MLKDAIALIHAGLFYSIHINTDEPELLQARYVSAN